MKRLILPSFAMLIFSAVGCAPRAEELAGPYQKKADAAEWRWSDQEASLHYSTLHQIKGYEVRIIRPADSKRPWDPLTVRIVDKDAEVCSFSAHSETVFTQRGDVLYVAHFSPIATGCSVVAYDLKARKELWKCHLKGNPPPGHSEYRHQVNITADGDAVLVYGKESNGRYIEYVDAETGKTVGHKKLPPLPEP
jgi:hypothetical protein